MAKTRAGKVNKAEQELRHESAVKQALGRTPHGHAVPVRDAEEVDLVGMECIHSGTYLGKAIIVAMNEEEVAILVDGVPRATFALRDMVDAAIALSPGPAQ